MSKPPKLTKTEIALLVRAKRRPDGPVIFHVSHGLQGTYKTRPYGVREHDAAQALVVRGFAKLTNQHSSQVYTGTQGYFVPVTDATYTLTPEGICARAAFVVDC